MKVLNTTSIYTLPLFFNCLFRHKIILLKIVMIFLPCKNYRAVKIYTIFGTNSSCLKIFNDIFTMLNLPCGKNLYNFITNQLFNDNMNANEFL